MFVRARSVTTNSVTAGEAWIGGPATSARCRRVARR